MRLDYKAPVQSKRRMMADFYTLQCLPVWKLNDTRSGDMLQFLYDEYLTSVVMPLKKQLLDAVFFSICAEFRHVYDRNTVEDIFKHVGYCLKHVDEHPNVNMELCNFMYKYNQFRENNTISGVTRRRKHHRYKNEKNDYVFAYDNALYTGYDRNEIVKFAEYCFDWMLWRWGYGDEPWSAICSGWVRLYNATDLNEIVIAIDHIYDLEHNSDTVFDKLRSYKYNDGDCCGEREISVMWLKNFLDKKANILYSYELWNDMSKSLRPFVARVYKEAINLTYEKYVYLHHEPKPSLLFISTPSA